MRYDISRPAAPKMPSLGRVTEFIKILLLQASNDLHERRFRCLFPVLGAYFCVAEFRYHDYF